MLLGRRSASDRPKLLPRPGHRCTDTECPAGQMSVLNGAQQHNMKPDDEQRAGCETEGATRPREQDWESEREQNEYGWRKCMVHEA